MRRILLMLATVAVLGAGALVGTAQADHGRYGGYGHGGYRYGGYGGYGHGHDCYPSYRSSYYYRPQYYHGHGHHHHHHHGYGHYQGGGIHVHGRAYGIHFGY